MYSYGDDFFACMQKNKSWEINCIIIYNVFIYKGL